MGFTKKEMEEKGFTEEQIGFVMAERGKELNESKAKLEELQKQLSDKESMIADLSEKAKAIDGTEATLKELQNKVATYEQTEQARIEQEKQAKLDSELFERFKATMGENKFNHGLVEKGRFEEFKKALADEQFKGKGDSDIFQAIVKPEDLANPQQQTLIMPGGSTSASNLSGVELAFLKKNPTLSI